MPLSLHGLHHLHRLGFALHGRHGFHRLHWDSFALRRFAAETTVNPLGELQSFDGIFLLFLCLLLGCCPCTSLDLHRRLAGLGRGSCLNCFNTPMFKRCMFQPRGPFDEACSDRP